MIVHTTGTDTYRDIDWEEDDVDIPVTSAVLTIDGVDVSTSLLTINDQYAATIHIPADYPIAAGLHTYRLDANDGSNTYLLTAGNLTVDV